MKLKSAICLILTLASAASLVLAADAPKKRKAADQKGVAKPKRSVNVAERVGHSTHGLEREGHRAGAGAAGEHKRTVDVEKKERDHSRKPILA